jgi:hypothetical protein
MIKIFEIILPFALNLVGRWLSYNDEKLETKKKWLAFIEDMDHSKSRSKRIKKITDKLKKDIYEEILN